MKDNISRALFWWLEFTSIIYIGGLNGIIFLFFPLWSCIVFTLFATVALWFAVGEDTADNKLSFTFVAFLIQLILSVFWLLVASTLIDNHKEVIETDLYSIREFSNPESKSVILTDGNIKELSETNYWKFKSMSCKTIKRDRMSYVSTNMDVYIIKADTIRYSCIKDK